MNTKKMLAMVGFATLAFAGTAHAFTEEATLPLTLLKTHMKVSSETMWPADSRKDGFNPTAIYCPPPADLPCTVRVEVSFVSQEAFSPIQPLVDVTVDDSNDGVGPPYFVFESQISLVTTHTAAFMKEGLAPGQHTVNARFQVLDDWAGSASVDNRLLTIQVLKPTYELRR